MCKPPPTAERFVIPVGGGHGTFRTPGQQINGWDLRGGEAQQQTQRRPGYVSKGGRSRNLSGKIPGECPLEGFDFLKYICAGVKSRYIGDGHPTFNKNPCNGI